MPTDRYGTHRVLEPRGVLPQAAWRLDNTPTLLASDEVLIHVETLNVDSASFRQMEEARAQGEDEAAAVIRQVAENLRDRGKQHNRVTGSGGMLIGRIAEVGADSPSGLVPGERIATLCSLTLTPLHVDRFRTVHVGAHQIDVDGRAVLFASSPFARLPSDLGDRVALAALDVAGAAPQTSRLVTPGMRVLVLGCGGKSGLLVAAAARQRGAGQVIGVEHSEQAAAFARRLGACHDVVVADARDAVALARAVDERGGPVDLTVSCVNVADAEMAAILATRHHGTIYFFSMATSFTKAALGAEGISRDVSMLVGNGYCDGHAEATLTLLREDALLRELFEERFERA